tara:strand:+ start:3666 stop:4514 length:849 start_codon:yes stop_codon:yes gene_type:complete
MFNNTYFVRLINRLYHKLYSPFEPIFRLNETEKKGNFLKLTYCKILLSPKVQLPYELGRTIRGTKFDRSKDIYSKVVAEILNNKSSDEVIKILFNEYQNFEHKSVSDINNFLTSSRIISYPSWLMVLPWDNSDIITMKKNYLLSFYKNRSENGMSFIDKTLKHYEEKIFSYDTAKSHVNQFERLINKIKDQGYIENNYDNPTAVILIKDNKWRWIMSSSGNHRAHIKKELNYDYITCKVSGVVNFSKLHRLKNVVNGIFNEKEAAILFDNVFKGEVPVRGAI